MGGFSFSVLGQGTARREGAARAHAAERLRCVFCDLPIAASDAVLALGAGGVRVTSLADAPPSGDEMLLHEACAPRLHPTRTT